MRRREEERFLDLVKGQKKLDAHRKRKSGSKQTKITTTKWTKKDLVPLSKLLNQANSREIELLRKIVTLVSNNSRQTTIEVKVVEIVGNRLVGLAATGRRHAYHGDKWLIVDTACNAPEHSTPEAASQ